MSRMTTPWQTNPCPRVMKLTILVDPLLFVIIVYSVCLIYAQEMRERVFKKYIKFDFFFLEN